MGFQTKNQILKSYGIGLVELSLSNAELFATPEKGLLKNLKNSLDSRVKELEKEHGEKDRKIIIESMATALLEKGIVTFAYELYKKSNIKKANLIKKTLPYEL